MNTNQFKNLEKSKKIKVVFSRIGFVLFFSSIILEIILGKLIFFNKISFVKDNMYLVNSFTNFMVTYPLIYIMLRRIPRQYEQKTDFSKKDLFRFFLIGVFVLCVGSVIGNIVSYLLSHGNAVNPVYSLLSGENLLPRALIVCVLAPIFEELIFRKLFIDIIVPYGEKISIVFTAFCFALFHGNLFQLFYAFALGLIFGYVYVKSRKVTNTIILHTCYNFIGGILPIIIMKNINVQKLLDISDLLNLGSSIPEELIREILPSIFVYMGYSLVYIIMVVAGLIMFMKSRKKFNLQEPEGTSKEYLSAFLNYGTILFTIICICSIIVNLKST